MNYLSSFISIEPGGIAKIGRDFREIKTPRKISSFEMVSTAGVYNCFGIL